MTSLIIDQEFQGLIPPLTAEEYKNLEENIKADGCRDALVIWNDTIIDGHNRYRICQENNIPYKTTEMAFKDRNEAIVWMLRNQLGRRNLNDFQRNEVALKFQNVIAAQMKERQKAAASKGGKSYSPTKGKTNWSEPSNMIKPTNQRKELAKIAGTSEGSIQRSKKILDEGTPEQIERARKGGKGNNITAIVKEIDKGKQEEAPAPGPVKVETKMCIRCRSEKPLSQFRRGRDICNSCRNPNSGKYTDLKGNRIDVSPEIAKVDMQEIINDIYDEDKVVTWGIDEAIELFNLNFDKAIDGLDLVIGPYRDALMPEGNNQRFIQAADEAIRKLKELKGRYTYVKQA